MFILTYLITDRRMILCTQGRRSLWDRGASSLNFWTITNVPQYLLSSYLLRLYQIYLNSVNCRKFGQPILRNMTKIVSTGCHILRLFYGAP